MKVLRLLNAVLQNNTDYSAKGVIMESVMNNAEEILDRQVCGFHRYVFSSPVHLDYVSQNLCELTGVTKKDLLDGKKDQYLKLVHPADREKYSDFIHRAAQKEQTAEKKRRFIIFICSPKTVFSQC